MQHLEIVNWFDQEGLPDPIKENIPRQTKGITHSYVKPLQFSQSKLLHTSSLYKELALSPSYINSTEFAKIVTGQLQVPRTEPYAMAYSGHQFGHWAGQLGDGRAINLFDAVYKDRPYMFQLKGAGPTAYSRRGDGMAVLRSSIREHLCSEAMHHLGVPTTRSLSLSLSGVQVLRDKMYTGDAAYEPGAIVCRVAPSFVRFGNFEHFTAQQDDERLKALADYTIKHFYTDIDTHSKHKYFELFSSICDKTLTMILHWQRVGFVHGVMNTDNMSVLGLTIDYGPYGWLEPYDHQWTPNTTDKNLRYAYGNQPEISLWNLLQLANAFYPLINNAEALEEKLMSYKKEYYKGYHDMMKDKLGWKLDLETDASMVSRLTQLLQLHETDMTIFFRELSKVSPEKGVDKNMELLIPAFYNYSLLSENHAAQWKSWITDYCDRVQQENMSGDSAFAKARSQKMNTVNPKYVLRNYIAQLVIDAAEKEDYSLLNEVYEMLKNPYATQPKYERWYAKRPEWARTKVGCSMLSCSS